MRLNTKKIAVGAIIGAIYAVLTVAIAPLSYGVMQFRISEALTILPAFTPAAIPGLFIGCVVSNLLSPVGLIDVVVGSTATLIAAICTYKLRAHKFLIAVPPILANAVLVGLELYYIYGVDFSLIACMLWVGLGEAIACYGLGYPLSRIFERHKRIFN